MEGRYRSNEATRDAGSHQKIPEAGKVSPRASSKYSLLVPGGLCLCKVLFKPHHCGVLWWLRKRNTPHLHFIFNELESLGGLLEYRQSSPPTELVQWRWAGA